jgi:CRP-like cAMP-binding protein
LDGEISIMKKKRVHSLVDFVTENVILVKLGRGKYFGETALESQEGLRRASAIASKNSNLLSLNRNDYQNILIGLKILQRCAVKRILSSPSSIFYHLSSDILDKLSEVIVMRTFTLHEEIFLAGEKVNSLYIVKTGLVKLIKPISSLHMANVLAEVDKKYAPPEVKTFAHSHNNNDNNHTTTNNYNRPQRPVTTGAHHLVFKLSIFNITMILVVTVTLKIAIMIWIFILSIRLLILRQLLI